MPYLTETEYSNHMQKQERLDNINAELLEALKLSLDALEHCARLPIVEQAEDVARSVIAKVQS